MNETQSVPYLDQILKFNEALLGLPALPLVLLLALALGYVFKWIPVYPNDWIPLGVIVGAMAANVGIAYNDGSGNYARAFIYGLIVGVASIAIHRKWLKDWLDPKMFGVWLLCGLLAFGATGCGVFQAKPAKVATNISDASKITVEAALRAWNDYIPVGKPSLEQQAQVRDAWKKYKAAQLLLLDCAIIVKESEAAGLNDPQAQEALNISIAEASNALGDLVNLLRAFNVKI